MADVLSLDKERKISEEMEVVVSSAESFVIASNLKMSSYV